MLKSDYKVHVARSSAVVDHCCVYALSDPKRKEFAHTCDHENNESFHECSNMTNALDEVQQLLEKSDVRKEILDRSVSKFLGFRECIQAWKAHVLRSINEDLCREELIEDLSEDSVYLYLDWVMKFLPVKSREPQSDFFGKRGISWHATVVIKRCQNERVSIVGSAELDMISVRSSTLDEDATNELSDVMETEDSGFPTVDDSRYEYKVFVHVFDQCTQDSETVLAIVRDVWDRIKSSNAEIRNAFIRSDNAGCYHSAETIVSVVEVSKLTGIKIRRIDFCDAQGGKGPCDRYAALIKSNVCRYLNENHGVTNESEFVEACHSHKGVKGVFALNCRIEKSDSTKNKKCTIKLITNFYNFQYASEGVLVHRAWNVGSGLPIQWSRSQLQRNIRTVTAEESLSYEHQWAQMKAIGINDQVHTSDNAANENEMPSIDSQRKTIYECDVVGCTSEFLKFGNLMNHVVLGKHLRSVEKFSLTDTAMELYQ